MIEFINKVKKIIILFFINNFLSTTRFFEIKRNLLIYSGFEIGKGTKIVGPVNIGTCAKLSIGNNCWIGSGISIYGNGIVVIGDNCDLAPDIGFVTGSHLVGDVDRRAGEGLSYTIQIGDGCWIGVRTTIVGDICIHNSSIIGACSLVNKNVPASVIAVGVPARISKKI